MSDDMFCNSENFTFVQIISKFLIFILRPLSILHGSNITWLKNKSTMMAELHKEKLR